MLRRRKSLPSNYTIKRFNVADTQPFKPVEIYDEFSTFEMGMNSGLEPELLPKNQLAFASNATVRDGFAESRPPFSKRHLQITWQNDEVQEAVEQGLFQGAAYYQPDTGSQSLFAAIAGRLYQFQITGNSVIVNDRTITGDANPAETTQAWLWQAENFLIWNDGQSLPVFWDGSTTRRSYGPSVLLGTLTGGESIGVAGTSNVYALATPYTGQFNVPVLIDGAYFQPLESTTGYQINATCLFDIPGTAIPVGTPVYAKPVIAFVMAGSSTASGSYAAGATLGLNITTPFTGVIGSNVILFGKVWTVFAASASTVSVRATQSGTFTALPAGSQVQYSSSTSPNILIGTVTVADVAPAIGLTVQLDINAAFSGSPGQIVYIGDQGQYSITAIPPGTPSGASIRLLNINHPAVAAMPANAEIISVPELTAGRMGAYGLGQNWVCLVDGLNFVCSDISRGPSGTQAYSFRDAVLKTTDLTFQGGNFAIPGAGNFITSMTFTANLDLSLGQGSLQVGTPAFMASVQSPIDFDNPPANGPILTFSLIGNGPLAQNSTIRVNSDVYFRQVNGFGSLVQARRDFNYPGNTPMGREMVRVLALDDQKLLNYGSGCTFDNRWVQTVSPQATSQGVLHAGFSVLNLDPLSGITQKKPPVYDGLWTGINTLQIISGVFDGRERCFAFTFNVALSKIELYELFPSGTAEYADDGFIPITWTFETPVLFNRDIKPPMQKISLRNGEIAIDRVRGAVTIQAFYRFDKACWEPWHQFTLCADDTGDEQYFPRLGLGEPSAESCDSILNLPARDGYLLQVKFVVKGRCRFTNAKFAAVTLPQEKYAPPRCNETIQVETITTE